VFELTYKNNGSVFSVILNRDVSGEEAIELHKFGYKILGLSSVEGKSEETQTHPPMVSARPDKYSWSSSNTSSTKPRQTKLGQFPYTDMSLGTYKEPESGVRLKMVACPPFDKRVFATRLMMTLTGISMVKCYNILLGNRPSPVFTEEVAARLMNAFCEWEIFARLEQVSANSSSSTSTQAKKTPELIFGAAAVIATAGKARSGAWTGVYGEDEG
jgi:hypothetical protein